MKNQVNSKTKQILDELRAKMIDKHLIIFAATGTVALLFSLLRIFTVGVKAAMVFQIFFILTMWVLVLFRKYLKPVFKGVVFLIIYFILALTAYMSFGVVGSGPTFSILFVVIASHMFGIRGGVTTYIFGQILTIVIAIAFVNHWLVVDLDIKSYHSSPANWMSKNTIYSCYMIGMIYMIYIYYKALSESLQESVSSKDELEIYKNHLEDLVAVRTEELSNSEAKLIKAVEKTESANRAKSSFLANMSHEIRTPLNAVIGFSELLQNKLTDTSQKAYVDSIKTSGQSLLSLINDILDLSKIESGKIELLPTPISVEGILDEMRSIFSFKVEQKKLEMIVVVQPDFPEAVLLDELRVRQVMMNIIGNSVKYTERGTVKVFLNYEKVDNSKINIVFIVEDTGIGVKDEFKTAIFDAFQQQTLPDGNKYEGTGLGLSITRRIVELMHGKISLESQFGKGTTMTVFIPDVSISSVSKKVMKVGEINIGSVIFESCKLLVVDDVEVNRHLVMKIFANTNVEVIEANNGISAIHNVELYDPDIIIMDIRMPMMDGLEATKRLKSNMRTKHIPIIALTASAIREDVSDADVKIFDGYLHKPVKISDLYAEVMRFVKYTEVKDGEISVDELANVDITEDNIAKSVEIIDMMKLKLMSRWEALQGKQSLQQIEAFSKLVVTEASNFNLKYLEDYAQNLWESIQNFDVEQKDRLFKDFPNVISKIVHRLKS